LYEQIWSIQLALSTHKHKMKEN